MDSFISAVAFAVWALAATPVTRAQSASAGAEAKAALGQRLFTDTRLSADGQVSCATCHRPESAFADARRVAVGTSGRAGTRNTPSLGNVRFAKSFFWDGRRESIEEQIRDPFVNPNEHGLPTHDVLLAVIGSDDDYLRRFRVAFDGRTVPSLDQIEQAIAAYVRSLTALASPFDRYRAGDARALTESQRRGLLVFESRGRCATCHRSDGSDAPFTDNEFHSGRLSEATARELSTVAALLAKLPREARFDLVSARADVAALGRYVVTLEPADIGKFRTPSLRNVVVSAPYMHDGAAATLEQAIELEAYSRSDRTLILTPSELSDVAAFLESLTSAVVDVHGNAHQAAGPSAARSPTGR